MVSLNLITNAGQYWSDTEGAFNMVVGPWWWGHDGGVMLGAQWGHGHGGQGATVMHHTRQAGGGRGFSIGMYL